MQPGHTMRKWGTRAWSTVPLLLAFVAGGLATQGMSSLSATGVAVAQEEASDNRVYELRTYTTHPGRLDALNKRFANHTIGLFAKHGMKNLMYWVPTDPKLSQNTLIYVLEHQSEAAAKESWAGFINDPEWKAARDASEKDGKIVEKVEAVYMKAVPYSPHLKRN